MLSQCPRFDGDDGGNDDTNAGTVRHRVLASMLAHGPKPSIAEPLAEAAWLERRSMILSGLPDEERDGVEWAFEYILVNAPMSDHPLEVEVTGEFIGPDFSPVKGTPDVVCGNHIFDLKWRERDYTAQMAAYSLMNEHDEVTVHVLFAESKRARRINFTTETAEAIVLPIIEAAHKPDAVPVANDYCDWCANRIGCPAHTTPAAVLAKSREDVSAADNLALGEWILAGAHTSDLKDAKIAGTVLRVARVLAHWCDAVDFHCKELALKQGVVPAGFKIQERKGNRIIASVTAAFERAGLPQPEFLAACEVKFSALAETFSKFHGLKKTAAEKAVEEKLGDTVQRKPANVSLVVEKE